MSQMTEEQADEMLRVMAIQAQTLGRIYNTVTVLTLIVALPLLIGLAVWIAR